MKRSRKAGSSTLSPYIALLVTPSSPGLVIYAYCTVLPCVVLRVHITPPVYSFGALVSWSFRGLVSRPCSCSFVFKSRNKNNACIRSAYSNKAQSALHPVSVGLSILSHCTNHGMDDIPPNRTEWVSWPINNVHVVAVLTDHVKQKISA